MKKNVRIIVVTPLLAVILYFLRDILCDQFKEEKANAIRVENDLRAIPHSDPRAELIPNPTELTEGDFVQKGYFEEYFAHAERLIDEMARIDEIIKKMDVPRDQKKRWGEVSSLYQKVFDEPKQIDESNNLPADKLKAARNVVTSVNNIHAAIVIALIDEFIDAAAKVEEKAERNETVCNWTAFAVFVLGVLATALGKKEVLEIG